MPQPETMIDRMADALKQAMIRDYDTLIYRMPDNAEFIRHVVRAVVDVMEKPTKALEDAFFNTRACFDSDEGPSGSVYWSASIRAILAEHPNDRSADAA